MAVSLAIVILVMTFPTLVSAYTGIIEEDQLDEARSKWGFKDWTGGEPDDWQREYEQVVYKERVTRDDDCLVKDFNRFTEAPIVYSGIASRPIGDDHLAPVQGYTNTIYLRSDGTVDPITAPISVTNKLYTFTDHIYETIIVEIDDIVVNGNYYSLRGVGDGNGIYLSGRRNVTIMNVNASGWFDGFQLRDSSNIRLLSNNSTSSSCGFRLHTCSNSTLSGNYAADNVFDGFRLSWSSDNNTLQGNNASANGYTGYWLSSYSYNNTLIENYAYSNTYIGFHIESSSNNLTENYVTNNYNGFDVGMGLNNTLSGNLAEANENCGFVVSSRSSNSTLSGNIARDNRCTGDWAGGFLIGSSNSTFTENHAVGNSKNGFITLQNSNNNTFLKNLVELNGYAGFYLWGSSNNTLSANNVVGNTFTGYHLWEGSNNNTLSGNFAVNNGWAGFYLGYSSNNTLTLNSAIRNGYGGTSDYAGFYIVYSSNNTLVRNLAERNMESGYIIAHNSNNILSDNDAIENDYCGFFLFTSVNNTLWRNSATNNLHGFLVTTFSDNNTLTENHASSNTNIGFYLKRSSNNTVIDNVAGINALTNFYLSEESENNTLSNNYAALSTYGFCLFTSSNNTLMDNFVSDNTVGFNLFSNSEDNIMAGNTVTNNERGFSLSSSSNPIIGNSIDGNDIGIRLYSCSELEVWGNTLTRNGYGVEFWYSYNIYIYHNNFLENDLQAFDSNPTDNYWYHPVLQEGNYWSDYPGVDDGSGSGKHGIAGDGIGDTIIPWPESNFDDYPLIQSVAFIRSGSNIVVSDSTTGIEISFSEIISEGVSWIVVSDTGPAPADGFRVAGQYYDIVSTADYEGIITLAVPYDEALITGNEADLTLEQWNPGLPGWEEITTWVDTVNNIIYGETTHLSIFVVLESLGVPLTLEFIVIITVVGVVIILIAIVRKIRRGS